MKKEFIGYEYVFSFKNGQELRFDIRLEPGTLKLIPKTPVGYPDWIILTHRKCPVCPLDEEINRYCPVAKNLIGVVDSIKGFNPSEEIEVTINSDNRTYKKTTTLDEGIRSLLGIYMVTSGCPVLNKLRPMVLFHLPFASPIETRYRAITMYLMAQYFRLKDGKTPDWELKNFSKIYDDVRVVDKSFKARLADSPMKEATISAVSKLNSFAEDVSFSILDKNTMEELKALFDIHLKD